MSEKLHQHHEKAPEAVDAGAEAKHNLERIHKAAEHAKDGEKHSTVEKAQHKANKEAVSGKDVAVEQKPSGETGGFRVERQLKAKAYEKSLHQIRGHLSAPERALSKFTHNNTVDKTSAVAGKTIARPNGIMGGAICALLGSIITLYISRHYGFSYNYLLFVALFIGGYLLGSALELLLWALVGRRRQKLS